MHDGEASFKIAKDSVSPATHKKLVQHFADGGGVQEAPKEAPPFDYVPAPSAQDLLTQAPNTYGFESGSALNPAPGSEVSSVAMGEPAKATPAMASALESQGTPIPPPAEEKKPEAKPEAAPAPAAPPMALMQKMPSAPGALPGIEKQLGRAYDAQGKAATEVGQAESEKYMAQAKALGQQAQAQQLLFESQQRQFAENQAKTDAAAKDVAAGRVEPEHFMATRTTGQKIGNVIAMLLGGIGAGLSGGENPVLGIINGQIQRDIEAQKIGLETKQSLLRHYVEQGHDLRSAAQLAFSTQQQIWAAKLEAQAAASGSPVAIANAQQVAAQLKTQGLSAMQEAHERTLHQTGEGLDIALKRYQMGSIPAQRAAEIAAESGRVLPEDYGFLLDAKRRVKVPGGWALTNREEDAKELTDVNQAHANGLAAIKRYEDLGGKTGLGGATTDEGKLAVQDALNAYQAVLGRSNAPRGGQEAELEKALTNPTSMFTDKAAVTKRAKLFRDILNKHMVAANKARLIGGQRAAAGMYGGAQ